MDTYTISRGSVSPGIDLTDGAIVVGERGRGRALVRIPIPPGATLDGDRLIAVPGPAGAAVVLVRDHSGFRGGWSATAPIEEGTAVEEPRCAYADGCEGHSPRRHGTGCPASGWVPLGGPVWQVLAEGRCAQGEAGAAGGGPEYLVVLRDGQSVDIHRRGRLYGQPSHLRVRCEGGIVTAVDVRAAAAEAAAGDAWAAVTGTP